MARCIHRGWLLLTPHNRTHPSAEVSQASKYSRLPLTSDSDFLQVAIDVSGDGRLPWPPSTQSANSSTLFHNITLFLTSESQSHNFTISNGTVPSNNNTYVGPVLNLEPSSTVKHVNWVWPECLVGDGSSSDGSARGDYNISMHQSFRWNSTDYYTVFDLPISVTNSIPKSSKRVDCALLQNKLWSPSAIAASSDSLPGQPWVQGGVSTYSNSSRGSGNSTSRGARMSLQKMLVLATTATALTLLH